MLFYILLKTESKYLYFYQGEEFRTQGIST